MTLLVTTDDTGAVPQATRLSVGLLGEFEVRRNDTRLGLGSRHTEALFAYLVHTGKVHARDHLAEVLWNEDSASKAAGNLRVLLTNLRRTVGDFVEITRTTVAFRPPGHGRAEIDVHAFTALSTAPLRTKPDALGPSELDHLETALRLCRRDFLERFDLPGCVRFDDWLRQERQRLHEHRVAVLSHLIEAELSAAATPLATQHARPLLELEPLEETSHQLMIRTHVQSGDLDGAVRVFERLERMLRTEFGSAPTAATRALFAEPAALRIAPQRDVASPGPAPSTPSAIKRNRVPWARFVGRNLELEAVFAGFALAREGTGSVLHINGEAGSGKTTLVRQAVRLLIDRDRDVVVLGGSCADPAASGEDDLLLANLLSQLAGDTSGPWLERPIPAPMAARLGGLAGSSALALERELSPTARVTAAIRRLAADRPVVLVLDDLHWAAPGIVNLVMELARASRHRRLLMICTARPEDLRRSDSGAANGAALLARTRRLAGGRTLDLDHDDPERRQEFLGAVLAGEAHQLSSGFRAELLARTEGHPLITVELLRELVRKGQIVRSKAGSLVSAKSMQWPGLSRRVELMVEERLGAVPDDLRELLEIAAVQGCEFDAHVVAKVCRREVGSVISDLSRRLGRDLRIVLESESADLPQEAFLARYRFRHRVVRDYVAATLDRAEHAHLLAALTAAVAEQRTSTARLPATSPDGDRLSRGT